MTRKMHEIRSELISTVNDRGLGHVEVLESKNTTTVIICNYDSQTCRAPEGEPLAAVSVPKDENEYLVQSGEGTGRGYDVTTEEGTVDSLDDALDLAEQIVTDN